HGRCTGDSPMGRVWWSRVRQRGGAGRERQPGAGDNETSITGAPTMGDGREIARLIVSVAGDASGPFAGAGPDRPVIGFVDRERTGDALADELDQCLHLGVV